jgi:hypothetical protein
MGEAAKGDWEMTVESLYRCPDCRTFWRAVWDSACDDECGACGAGSISPVAYRVIEGVGAGGGVIHLR